MVKTSGPRPKEPTRGQRRICVFTGTRAEYGLLKPLINRLWTSASAEVSLLVTGAHLSARHGATLSEIDTAGLAAVELAPLLDGDDSDHGVAKAMSRGLAAYAAALGRLQPDLFVILGDRYEALAAAAAATVCKCPIAHLHGGELSLGAMDDVFRHAITKMSHLHFASTEAYRARIIAMGEHPDRVFNFGALGVENAMRITLLDRSEVEARLKLRPGQRFAVVTYHPETLDSAGDPKSAVQDLLRALLAVDDLALVVTGANADAGGKIINAAIIAEAQRMPSRIIFRQSLGSLLYLSALKFCSLVAGNSSSGVIEAPSFGVPVIDIGLRQSGRIKPENIIPAEPSAASLGAAVASATNPAFSEASKTIKNPYFKPGTADNIAGVLLDRALDGLLSKGFFDHVRHH